MKSDKPDREGGGNFTKLLEPTVLFSGFVIAITLVIAPLAEAFWGVSAFTVKRIAWIAAACVAGVYSLLPLRYLAECRLIDRIVYVVLFLPFPTIILLCVLGVLPPD